MYRLVEMVKRWDDCTSEAERQRALVVAIQSTESAAAAARALGIGRQYLHRLLKRMGYTVGDVVSTGYAVASVAAGDVANGDSDDASERGGGVSSTLDRSLTYRRPLPSLRGVSTQAIPVEDTQTLSLPALPRSDKEWLEEEALALKRQTGASRLSITAVISRLIQAERARREGGEL